MKARSQVKERLLHRICRRAGATHTRLSKSERGASLAEMALVLPLLSLLLLGAIDFGRAFYLAIEVASAARAGAQYGYQSSATMKDTSGIQTAASNDAREVTGMTTTSSWGCMCSDGTGQSTNCSSPPICTSSHRQVNYVTVNTSMTYRPLFPWPSLPSSIPLNGQATLWAGQ